MTSDGASVPSGGSTAGTAGAPAFGTTVASQARMYDYLLAVDVVRWYVAPVRAVLVMWLCSYSAGSGSHLAKATFEPP